MKILVFIDDERKASGPFVVTLRLYKALNLLFNHQIKFVVSGCDICYDYLKNEGFDTILVNSKITYARENIKSIFSIYSNSYNIKKNEFEKIINDYCPDVIHCTVHPLSLMLHELIKHKPISLLVGFHSTHKKALLPLYRIAYKNVLNSEKVTALCVSNWIKRNLELLQKNGKSEIFTLYNGIEITEDDDHYFMNEKGYLEIVYVAQIRKEKGLHVFLEVCEKIYNELDINTKLKISIYGHGFDQKYNLKISKQIEFLKSKYKNLEIISKGYVKDVVSQIRSADLMIVPSLFPDPLPTVIMEAQSLGIPVVGFNRGGIPELLNNDSDFLVESNSILDMKIKSLKILTSKDIFYRVKSRKIVKSLFDINKTAVKFNSILQKQIKIHV